MRTHWMGIVALTLLTAPAGHAQTVITVDPLVRYQKYLGVGGTGQGDFKTLVPEMGMSVHRVCLDAEKGMDDSLRYALESKAAAKAAGQEMIYIASNWSPPPEMKVGPFVKSYVPVDAVSPAGR